MCGWYGVLASGGSLSLYRLVLHKCSWFAAFKAFPSCDRRKYLPPICYFCLFYCYFFMLWFLFGFCWHVVTFVLWFCLVMHVMIFFNFIQHVVCFCAAHACCRLHVGQFSLHWIKLFPALRSGRTALLL